MIRRRYARERPFRLLSQNSELREDGVFAWTLPALAATLADGRRIVTCPHAGICAQLCYARSGTFQFPSVIEAHTRKLDLVVNHLAEWERWMDEELHEPHVFGRMIRIHDSGDFFSREYAEAWLRLAWEHPDKHFYAYTKEVRLLKYELADLRPPNLTIIYSLGGREDHLVDRETDRHAEVFPTLEALLAAGYADNGASDTIAALSPNPKIGIVANNHPHLRKRQGAYTFGELQQDPVMLVRRPHAIALPVMRPDVLLEPPTFPTATISPLLAQ